MKFGTFAATAFGTIAALGMGAGIVHADPPSAEIAAAGMDHEIAYRTVLTDSSRVSTTTVAGGRFTTTEDRIVLRSDAGTVLTEIPLTYRVRGTLVRVSQRISDDGHRLELEPRVSAREIGEMQPVSSMARLTDELNRNVVGLVAGGVLGGLLGTILGMGFFSLLTGPIGLVVGAVAGAYITGGQSFADAVAAVLNGEP
ncbi:hypothetical protein NDR87_06890 [Nocardia sp. CDC159]|uniref:DUF8020 domain-containing protein n=1 Tax=Nocardia pulmonis TaxID=2951408 RepID=A0A9X2E1R5_9NOCA|nr:MULTISPECIES: hypothetical protein [Nocardia]MCM6772617.1 hypothetical protein [Nocardia pulmonis]MCM6786080.1 hypothetical protein [Nocardia sp. CDC159]